MLPELPDARMETRMPIVFSSTAAQMNFQNDGRAKIVRQRTFEIGMNANGT
jgi:hypothetical protein